MSDLSDLEADALTTKVEELVGAARGIATAIGKHPDATMLAILGHAYALGIAQATGDRGLGPLAAAIAWGQQMLPEAVMGYWLTLQRPSPKPNKAAS